MSRPLDRIALRRLVRSLGLPLACRVLGCRQAQVKDMMSSRQPLPLVVEARVRAYRQAQDVLASDGASPVLVRAWLSGAFLEALGMNPADAIGHDRRTQVLEAAHQYVQKEAQRV